jgi:hypothetical protein
MKSKILLIGACVTAGLIASCGGDDHSAPATTSTTPPPVMTTTTSVDTAQLLAMAQQTSETSSPFEVNGGAFVFIDTSETTAPIAVVQ